MEQLIHEPTHIIGERSSCIDLIFASQPNLVTQTGVESFLHQNCFHQIVFLRFNLKVVFPPPYKRELWHFKNQMFTILEKQWCPVGIIVSKYERQWHG